MKKIYKKEAESMIIGASILACGGGLAYDEQLKYLQRIPIEKGITLLDVDDLEKSDSNIIFVTASEIGPAESPPIKKNKLPCMIKTFTNKFKKKIGGIIPVEIGQESIVFDTALQCNLPIINTDLAGMRAVPTLYYNALKLQKVNFTRSPLIVLTSKEEIILISKNNSLEEDELQLRNIVKNTGGIIFAIGGFITANLIKKYLNYPSQTIIQKIGETLIDNGEIEDAIPLSLIFRADATVKSVDARNDIDFTERKVLLTGVKNQKYQLIIKNEYMKLVINDNPAFTFPQLIIVVDKNKKRGLASSELKIGSNVVLYVFQQHPFWNLDQKR